MDNKDYDEYSIFHYLKSNSSLLIAIISGVSALIVILLTASTYLAEAASLNYWNIPVTFLDISNRTKLYSVALVFVSAFMVPFISKFAFYYYDKNKFFIDNIAAINAFKERNKDDAVVVATLKTKRKKHISSFLLVSLIYYFVPLILLTLIYVGVRSYSLSNYRNAILLLLLIPIFITIFPMVEVTSHYFKKKREYSKVVKLADVVNGIKNPTRVSFKVFEKSMLTNKSIKYYLSYVVIFTIVAFSLFAISGQAEAEQKKQFSITIVNEQPYAIVYQTNNHVFLEKATIAENQMEIDTSKQIIKSLDDLEYTVKSFDSVSKIE